MIARNLIALAAAAGVLAAAVPAAAQPEAPPAPGPLRPYAAPRVQDFRLANGLRVVLVEKHELPIVTANLVVDAGALFEPAAKNGVAALTGGLLSEGTRTLTAAQLAERMESLGASYFTGGGQSTATMQVTALKDTFGEALALAATTVLEPGFRPEDFERRRTQAIAGFAQQQSTVEGLAAATWPRALYGPESPFGRLTGGTRESLQGLTRDDVVNWHATMYAPGNSTLVFVGDVTAAEARQLAERAFGSWRAQAPALQRPAQRPRREGGNRVILVDRPGSVQSAIWVGQGTIGITHPDYLRMVALNHVLGGQTTARVNANLRERHGWTYGAGSGFGAGREAGTLGIQSSVRTNATDSSLVEAVAEYRRIIAEPVPADEMQKALNNIISSFPSSVQTVQGIAGRMNTLVVNGMPLDFWTTYRERLAEVTSQQVAQVGRQHLSPEALTIVVVGDLSQVEAPVRALNLGTVEVWDANGNKVR
ncbi:MAG TPA: pitrilysin family protein [Longimicrobium sp.]|nr:pitrilysin family protein [Longimicrobium sp.]